MWATPASASTGEPVNPWVALAYLVEPTPRDATIEIPSERTNPPQQ